TADVDVGAGARSFATLDQQIGDDCVINVKLVGRAWALALLLTAGAASADIVVDAAGTPVVTEEGGSSQTRLVGSDSLNEVMDCLVNGCPGIPRLTLGQITDYVGQGSIQGQHQMEGSPQGPLTDWIGNSELDCTVAGPAGTHLTDPNGVAETNPGCQEIAP